MSNSNREILLSHANGLFLHTWQACQLSAQFIQHLKIVTDHIKFTMLNVTQSLFLPPLGLTFPADNCDIDCCLWDNCHVLFMSLNTRLICHVVQAIGVFGTNFELIAKVFPGRPRKALANKWRRESKLNPERIEAAFTGKGGFEALEKMVEAMQQTEVPFPLLKIFKFAIKYMFNLIFPCYLSSYKHHGESIIKDVQTDALPAWKYNIVIQCRC